MKTMEHINGIVIANQALQELTTHNVQTAEMDGTAIHKKDVIAIGVINQMVMENVFKKGKIQLTQLIIVSTYKFHPKMIVHVI